MSPTSFSCYHDLITIVLMMTIASVQAIPHFLFAGQSNMAGHADMNHLNMSMDILFNASRTKTEILSDLKQHYYSYPSNPSTSSERYDFMAEYLLNLKGEGILSKRIRQSQEDISCSYYQLDRRENSNPAETIVLDQPLSPNSCGKYPNCCLISSGCLTTSISLK